MCVCVSACVQVGIFVYPEQKFDKAEVTFNACSILWYFLFYPPVLLHLNR